MALSPTKYSDRPVADALDGTEVFVLSQVVSTVLSSVKVTVAVLKAFILSTLGAMAYIDDAPTDGTTYGREDGAWVAVSGGGGGGGGGPSAALVGINDQTGTSYTLVLGDAGKDIRCNNGATVTITIPPNSAVAFPVGTFLLFSQAGTGTVTAAAGAGVTLNAGSGYSTAGQHDVRGLEQVAADVWRVV